MLFFTLACVMLTASWVAVHAICNVFMPAFKNIKPTHKQV